MSSAKTTDLSVPLALGQPRQFRGNRSSLSTFTEKQLLSSPDPVLILGGPGCGKTTTVKRLARRLLTQKNSGSEIDYQFPLVIRLREMKPNASLHLELIKTVGLTNLVKPAETAESKEKWAKYQKNHGQSEPTKEMEDRLAGLEPETAIQKILNESHLLLLIDGLDELDSTHRASIHVELEALARALPNCKVIATCRAGDYNEHLDGFDILELSPLTSEQISQVATRWLKKSAPDFLASLEGVPYRDMAQRPLLLAQLINLFDDDGYLPHQPSDVYKRMLDLLLEQWNKQRGIRRISKYSKFSVDRKTKFLAALAYQLTFRLRTKTFSEEILVEAYEKIHRQLNLPSNEAREVARELESHTGIIVRGSRLGALGRLLSSPISHSRSFSVPSI